MENSITEKNIDSWVDYVTNQSQVLSYLSDFQLDSIIDNEILNPNVQTILSDSKLSGLANEKEETVELSLHTKSVVDVNVLRLWPNLKKLKRLVRKVFCQVMGPIADDKFDLKTVIKSVLLALVPFFAGGVPALLLPVIIPIIVRLFKQGVNKVCPVK
jgi:hypothetical protein